MLLRRGRPGHGVLSTLTLSLAVVTTLGCDAGGRPQGPAGLGEDEAEDDPPTVSEIKEGFDRVLSDAAAYVGDDSNWVYPADPEPGDDEPDTGDDADSGAGATCAGHCGDLGSDQSCYCDAECEGNGDCCGDYEAQCGGNDDGSNDDGSNDDGGNDDAGDDDGGSGPSATCAGHCGGVGSDESCYCDAECEGNGDCCGDYEAQCGGSNQPPAATCEGFCGGQGSDGSCYCDDVCSESGDCCDDYAGACGSVVVGVEEFGFTGEAKPSAGAADACWSVLADPLDVEPIVAYAGLAAAAAGTSCVAVVAVPAGAGAAPTAGLSIGAAALACGTVSLGGGATGALASVVSQKLPSIAQCSSEIVSTVIRPFVWGKGVADVRVQVYDQRPGNCDPDRHSFLQNQVNTTCKGAGQRRCTESNVCETYAVKLQQAAECIAARQKVADECFDGGDDGHQKAIEQEKSLHQNCVSLSADFGC